MKGSLPLVLGVAAASLLGGLALQGDPSRQLPWFISRASGIVAFALLSASVVLGLLMSGKAGTKLLPRPLVYEIHNFLGVLTLVVLGVHGGSLLFDGFFHFTPLSILVPFTAPYKPLWTGLGVIAAWGAAAVAASVQVRKRVGYRAWRRFHYVSFGAYVLAFVHGVTAGSDTSALPVMAMYVLSAGLVAGLLVYRISGRKTPARRRGPTPIPGKLADAA